MSREEVNRPWTADETAFIFGFLLLLALLPPLAIYALYVWSKELRAQHGEA